jgi:glucose/arabinose dehydrogenase
VKKAIATLFFLILVVGLWWLYRYYFRFGQQYKLEPGVPIVVSDASQNSSPTPDSSPTSSPTTVAYTLEPFVSNLQVPWSLVFTSPTRALVTERPGKLRAVENGRLLPDPIRTFPEVSNKSEEGLMGMTLDPAYESNHYIYLCIAYQAGNKAADKVVRLTDQGDKLTDDLVIIDGIPAAQYHAGCRLRFGPDGKLYISTGDATDKSTPQNLQSLGGKILRLNADGSTPTDNPFPNSPVWSYGHRNPQGLDWHPISGTLVETEHGPSGSDGPGGGDEVNIIKPGSNYGWPIVSHDKSQSGMVSPLLVYTPAIAPASGMFVKGNTFPQLTNTFLFGMLRGEGIIQVVFDAQNPEKILSFQKLPGINVGRVRDIVEGPDGYIYFTTSNQDGRGKAREGDDRVYRLVPMTTNR